jgi:Asp-tRNA(Asn)/Glu-tRNA(Gln) amidotransferase A subunit family amidase
MSSAAWTIGGLRTALAAGTETPATLAERALTRANSNAGRNTYLWQDAEWTRAEAERAESMPRGKGYPFGDGHPPLWGLPVSVKDCFDLQGARTTCGVRFYPEVKGVAGEDSWLVERLRGMGAVITGKTHLHPLAYGSTGDNPEFGDCVQPNDASALTGGSSSGAAASVQEGSAVVGFGTDTGGSIRTPAALCGLAGFRATVGSGDWRGGAHLAKSFDTMGCLFRDLNDAPMLAGLFGRGEETPIKPLTRFAYVADAFLEDCEPEIVAELHATVRQLEERGLKADRFDAGWWADAFEIFAPIQAWEAARIHAGYFDRIAPGIRERLEWGAQIGTAEIAELRMRHAAFRDRMDDLLADHEFLVLPATPVAKLPAGADHSKTRGRLLRYTTPFSLGGVPVVTMPCRVGGMQVAAARNRDERLLGFAALYAGGSVKES